MARKSTGSNRQHVIVFAAMLGLLVGGIAKTEAADYTFTKIADSTGSLSTNFSPPAINDRGVVAFSAQFDGGVWGIFTGDGNDPTTLLDSTGPFASFRSPSINSSGVVAVQAGVAIVRTDGSAPTTIAELFKGFWSLGDPSVNNDGAVVFVGYDSGSGIFLGDGTTPRPIAHTPSPFWRFSDNPSLNDRGAVAFIAVDDRGSGIFRSDGTTSPTTIAHTTGQYSSFGLFPSLNNEGAVAFLANLDGGGSGIFVSNGPTTTMIADSSSPFLGFGDSPSINDEGVVAFYARHAGGDGIFTGPDPVTHKVIAVGDTLDGPTTVVTSLTFGREGLNNDGAVAFVASLRDETGRVYWAVYRADPPSNEPPDCSTLQAAPGTLWSPDHTFRTVAITGVTDPDNDPVAITVTSIYQDEPVKGRGDGNTAPDGVGAGPLVMVRAERSGRGDGRVYHVSFTAEDGQGGTCTGQVAVCVPHDQRPGAACVDQGPLFDSTVGPEGPGG